MLSRRTTKIKCYDRLNSPIGALVIGAVVIKIGGSSLSDVVMRRLRFTRSKAAGWTDRTGGMVTDHLRRHDLPGPMGPIVPLSTDDGRGGKQGLLWDRRTGWLTAVLRVSPVGLDLADPGQADAWVANWGAFLADLGYQPMIRHVAVTVDTSPTGGGLIPHRNPTHQKSPQTEFRPR
ncbi:SCO6880 family protein [Pseudonocardia sp. Ae717_Ps2]|uniref:SCO6880 family protein n=1 Tax=Pseudonocardia sp. Ae717_Ps2 TaxID=1885573 RepID=UPI00350F0909